MRFPLPHAAVVPVCMAIGVLAVIWAVLALRSQRRFLGRALGATGVVQSLKAERMERSTVYFPVIRFTTAAGATVTATSKTARSGGYRIGKTIRVLYDPSQPDKLEIDAFWSRWLMVIGALFLAVVSFGIGAAALLNNQG